MNHNELVRRRLPTSPAPLTPLMLAIATALVLAAVSACGAEDDLDGADDELDALGGLDAVDVASSSAEQALRTNTDANRIVVYSNNIENMIFDWKDLVWDMAEAPLRPDVFLVQQLSGKDELDRLVDFMSRKLGAQYAGVVAQNHPADDRFGGEVHPRPKVTTGIIYRTARFSVVTKDSWMPFGRGFAHQPKTCAERSNNSGYQTLRLKLHDHLADENIVVISTRQWTWNPCSSKNMQEIVDGFDGGPNDHAGLGHASALHIVAGDFNDHLFDQDGNYRCWYRQMNVGVGAGTCNDDVDLGFTDPLFEACDGDKTCVRGRAGIDSLFVRRSDGGQARTDHFDVITWADAHRASVAATGGDALSNRAGRDGFNDVADRYSGHRARRAYVYYR